MRRFIQSVLLAGAVIGLGVVTALPGFAQDETGADQTAPAPVSQATGAGFRTGTLRDESVGLKPQIGALAFHDQTGNQTVRGGIGLAFDLNLSHLAAPVTSAVAQNIYFGISTGGLYSHLGNAGSNFFGSNSGSSVVNGGGANMVLVPVDAKLGYNLTDNFRISAHGGGNVIYNSAPEAMSFGDTSRNWQILPNVGGDIDIGLGKSVAITARPDWTFTSGVGFFTGTLEFGFALG